jgi:hypothetical protein
MTRRIAVVAMLSLLLSAGIGSLAIACPAGTIDHSGDVILRLGRPALLVETCVSEAGDMTTFTYRLTNWSRGDLELCSFDVPGLGQFSAAIQASPMGWTASHGIASECVTWWSWKSGRFVLGPGETVELSLSVESPASYGTIEGVVGFCAGGMETAQILAPSACAGGFPGAYTGCFCDAAGGGCIATELFEGEGNRINILSGPEEEINGICLGSWVRHGFAGGLPPDRYDFRLTIDGVEIPLERRVYCTPGTDVGNAVQSALWHVQFPADHFAPGSYEVTGQWLELADDGSVAGVFFERTITLTMIECLPIYPIEPSLPDLTARIDKIQCVCGWTPQQEFECQVDLWLTVANEGGRIAAENGVRIEINRRSTVRTVPELDPGTSHTMRVRVSIEVDPKDIDEECPLEVEIFADYLDAIEEIAEDNNTASACCEP